MTINQIAPFVGKHVAVTYEGEQREGILRQLYPGAYELAETGRVTGTYHADRINWIVRS